MMDRFGALHARDAGFVGTFITVGVTGAAVATKCHRIGEEWICTECCDADLATL